MGFRPRHYVLIAIILALGVFNFVRIRRRAAAAPVAVASSGPVAHSPAWSAFDQAASLRDAPEAQFAPVLGDLQKALQTGNDPTIANVKGCQIWLMYYRQQVLHPSRDTSWRDRSAQHLDTCVKTHQDAG